MKPTILSMSGDRPGGIITPAQLAQSIQLQGTGFEAGMILIDEGPNPKDRSQISGQVAGPVPYRQVLMVFSDTQAAAALEYPIDSNGPHRAILIGPDGSTGGWFSYQVG